MKEFLKHFSVRSMVILGLLGSVIYLAVTDKEMRPLLADLAKVGIGGYLGQQLPQQRD